MAITILPKASSDMGEFAKGVSSGLQALANFKMQEFVQRQQAMHNKEAFKAAFPDMSDEQAQAYSQASPELQKLFMQMPQRQAFEKGVALLGQEEQDSELAKLLPQMNPRDALAIKQFQETQKGKQVEAERKEAAAVQPFVEERSDYLSSLEKEKDIAEKMINIVKQHGGKFPTALTSSMPTGLQEWWIQDPDIRNYMTYANQLVQAASQDVKGRPSDYMTKLTEAGKAKLSLPNKSKINILQEVIDHYNQEAAKQKYIESQRNPKTGNLPKDIQSKATNYSLAKQKPLDWPEYYKENTVIEEKKKRYRRVTKDGKPAWKEI